MKINFYDGNIKNTKKAQIITIAEFLNKVKYETYKVQSDEIASITDKKARQKRKSEILPYVTISGVFSERNESGLLEHSGLIAIDVDGVQDLEYIKTQLSKDPHSFAVFKSVSGTGLCVLIKISNSAESHLSHFRWIEQYYYDNFNLIIDASCKDVSRPRYVSADAEIFINPNPKKAGKKSVKRTAPKKINWVATETQMDRIVSEIVSRGISIAESYEDFLLVALSIADGYGEGGRHYFHGVASLSDKYDTTQADKKFDNALKTKNGKVKIGSFFHLCKQAGIELRTEDESRAFAVARAAKKNHSDIASAIHTAETMGIPMKEAKEVIEKVFERNDINLEDGEIPIIEEIAALVKLNYNFKRNDITRLIVEQKSGRELDNTLLNTIYIRSKSHLGNKVSKHDIESIIYSDNTPDYNPFADFIEKNKSIPSNPGIIDEFINTLNLKDDRTKILVRRWLLAIPSVIKYETVRIVLTLIGKQKDGKTEWFRRMLPKELKPYFGESDLMKGKDDEIAMCSNLIILDDEMGGRSKKDSAKFKELTSKQIFMLREPYGRNTIKLPRLALLCATTNDPQVIHDATGNTRILPVELSGKYNFEAYNKINKTELFMELVRAKEEGEQWELTEEDSVLLEELTTEFETVNVEREYILKYFEPAANGIGSFLTTTEIKTKIEQNSGHKFFGLNKLGVELRKVFTRKKKYVGGSQIYGYEVAEVTKMVTSSERGGNTEVSDDLPF